jgi:glycosyltransferase involved in cell wall biosynthesis
MISIIIPTLNSGKYLSFTLDSILKQTYKNYEVILVDGGSSDNTFEVARSFSDNMSIFFHRIVGSDQVSAINYGLSKAHGNIMTFINSDDVYDLDCLSLINDKFLDDKIMWVYGQGNIIDEKGKQLKSIVTIFKSLFWSFNSYRILTWLCYIVQPTVFWRREVFDLAGVFNPKYRYCFDYEWWLRIRKIHKPMYIDKNLACWRTHSDSLSVKNTQLQVSEALEVCRPYAQCWIDKLMQKCVFWGVSIAYRIVR